MLTPEGKKAAHEEAKEWHEFLEWFDELYEFSFKHFRYTKGVALQAFLMSNCEPPREGQEDKEKWQK